VPRPGGTGVAQPRGGRRGGENRPPRRGRLTAHGSFWQLKWHRFGRV
jgi:hypothetical protein